MRTLRFSTLMALFALSLGAQDTEKLLEQRCGGCHIIGNPTIESVKHMSAPPMWGVARNLIRHFGNEQAFVDFVVDYVYHPSEEKMILDKAARERFGLMPSLKGSVPPDELRQIARYMYNHY